MTEPKDTISEGDVLMLAMRAQIAHEQSLVRSAIAKQAWARTEAGARNNLPCQ